MHDTTITNDRENQRFNLQTEKGTAFIDYTLRGDEVHLMHSEVPMELRGQGVGQLLVEKTFEIINQAGQQAVAHCGFIKSVAKNSEKWSAIVEY